MRVEFFNCSSTGPDKWGKVIIWSRDDETLRIEKDFDSLSDASDYAHEVGPFLKAGVCMILSHGETITYTIE